MLDARLSHLYFCQSLYTLQRGLPAIAGLLVEDNTKNILVSFFRTERKVKEGEFI